MNLIHFRRKSDGSFDSCHVYDIAHIAAGTDFDQAMASRGGDLKQIKCEDTSAPENTRFQYDHSEGLDTIVNNVSCCFCVHYINNYENVLFHNTYIFVVAFKNVIALLEKLLNLHFVVIQFDGRTTIMRH